LSQSFRAKNRGFTFLGLFDIFRLRAAFRMSIERIRVNFRYIHDAGTTLGTLATVIFWMVLVWVPGLAVMAHL